MSDVEPTLTESTHRLSVTDLEATIDLRDEVRPTTERAPIPPSDQLRRRHLFDLDFVDAPSLEPVVTSLLERRRPADESQLDTVLTPNVDIMVHLTRPGVDQSVEWQMFQRSQYCLPDGQPIVAASRLLGRPLGARLTGSGLFSILWPRLVEERRSVFMVGSSEVIIDRLQEEFAELRSVVAPMFDADDVGTIDGLAQTVVAAAMERPLEFVILGIGNPKDARITESLLRQWPRTLGRPPTILALGAAASMYVGVTKRASDWVQRIGMEWFYRFLQEPRRLFRRYFIRDLAFLPLVWKHWRSESAAEVTSPVESERMR